MRHYLAVLVTEAEGGWRTYFPGCRTAGSSIAAEQAARLCKHEVSLPHPQTYEQVRYHLNGWAAERGVDWSKAVISLVPLAIIE